METETIGLIVRSFYVFGQFSFLIVSSFIEILEKFDLVPWFSCPLELIGMNSRVREAQILECKHIGRAYVV